MKRVTSPEGILVDAGDGRALVLNLIEMDGRIILRDGKVKIGGGKTADGGYDRIGGNDPVALRNNKTDPGVEQGLLLKQNIKSGALADFRLLPDAVERDLGRLDRCLGRSDDRTRGKLAPGRKLPTHGSKPGKDQLFLLRQLKLQLPAQPPPKITTRNSREVA